MARTTPLRRDLFALVLLAVVGLLTVSLATYHSSDPVASTLGPLAKYYHPDVIEFPERTQFGNACGRWGALVADLLLTAFGVGAYYLVASLALFDYALLRRDPPDMLPLRITGWTGSLIGLTALAAIGLPEWSPGPMAGSGGYLGALGAGLLQHHFALLGSVILSSSFVLGGLLMCSDHLVPMVLKFVFGGFLISLLRRSQPAEPQIDPAQRTVNKARPVKIAVGKTTKKGTTAAAEPAAPAVEEGDEEEPTILPIRVRGKAGAATRDADEESDDEGADDDAFDRADSAADEEDAESFADEVDDDLEPPAPKKGRKGASEPARAAGPAKGGAPAESGPTSNPHFKVKAPADPRAEVIAALQQGGESTEAADYELPSLDLLVAGEDVNWEAQEKEVRRKAKILEKTFADFGFQVRVVEIETGPVIAQYEVELEAGLRLSKITSLADDLAIALRVPSVRIVAPIPGKNTVGIEVPNEERQVVRLREVLEETNGKSKKMRIPLYLGKDVSGNALVADLSTLPHLLIAGRTGTGKSVCLNAIIASILMTRRPDEVRMIMIDPKMVELSGYGRLPHLMHPVVTDMRKAEAILAWAVEKMEERYALLARAGVRHISGYNQLDEAELYERLQPEDEEAEKAIPKQLPFIVIVADEIADMMMTAGKEVEQHIIRLAQKSRAVGIHLILATQKPTVDVITGLIKSNLPARISFQVASRTDSRVVLDEMGADKLLGNGDMLFLWPGTSTLLRGQGTYLGDDEINRIVDFCSQGQAQNFASELVNIKIEADGEGGLLEKLKKRDELYESAVDVVVRERRGSCSLLQRALGIGYGRAARLIDYMAEDGIVGNYAGSQAREVLLSVEDWEAMQSGGESSGGGFTAASPPPSEAPKRKAPRASVEPPAPAREAQRDPDDEPRSASSKSAKKNVKPAPSAGQTTLSLADARRRAAQAQVEPPALDDEEYAEEYDHEAASDADSDASSDEAFDEAYEDLPDDVVEPARAEIPPTTILRKDDHSSPSPPLRARRSNHLTRRGVISLVRAEDLADEDGADEARTGDDAREEDAFANELQRREREDATFDDESAELD
ncbi:MAG: DNA translocase FtsK 4TM domain-containing protein [Pirellulales bacterium]